MNKIFLFFLSMFGWAEQIDQPEAESGFHEKPAAGGNTMMVCCANSYATQEGFEILKRGGSALDAAIAMQMILNVVEPQSSGIGGGAFLLYYDKKAGKVMAYDGRETAPSEVHEDWFLDT